MGRGRSKASDSGGGSNGLPRVTNRVAPPTLKQVQAGNVLPKGGVAFSDFENMTDDEKADVVDKALSTGVPMFLDDSGMQRFAYFTGMNNTPKVVSDAQLDSISGDELFRTVHDAYNPRKDIGFSANDIAKQITNGDFTMYSDSGGSAHGRAIYFADNVGRSAVYSKSGSRNVMIRAKVTGGKSIDEAVATRVYYSALHNGDKLAKACSKAGSDDARNLFMLAKGYDRIKDVFGYNMILNRRCLTVSSTTKSVNQSTNKWK